MNIRQNLTFTSHGLSNMTIATRIKVRNSELKKCLKTILLHHAYLIGAFLTPQLSFCSNRRWAFCIFFLMLRSSEKSVKMSVRCQIDDCNMNVCQKKTIATRIKVCNSAVEKCVKKILLRHAYLIGAFLTQQLSFCSNHCQAFCSIFFDVVIVRKVRQNVRQMLMITTSFLKSL